MVTLTSLGGTTMRMETKTASFVVFPKGEEGADIRFLDRPQEEPKQGEISWPGEYDMQGVAIRGIGHDEGARVSYALEIEDVRYAFLASPLHEWNDFDLELLGDVDVLCIPAEDAKLVQKMIDEVDPRVLIPLPTKDESTFEEVLKGAGAISNEIVPEYKVKGSLPAEGREVVVLKPVK